MKHTRIILAALLLLVTACSEQHQAPYAGVKVGKTYQIYGRTYTPNYEEDYDETGIASWYGPGFHGGKTASGERFDQNALTAAHRTLPLPSIVRVTNLDNGKSALVKVNDRGPFAHSRIIDLSKAAATQLGIIGKGTAHVRVQFLDRETREYAANLVRGKQYAMNSLKKVDPEEASRVEEARDVVIRAKPVEPAAVPREHVEFVQDAKAEPAEKDIFSVVEEKPAPPAAKAVTGKQFFVQAGTFGLEKNAQLLLERVSGFATAQVTELQGKGKNLYRVVMGPFDGQADAKNMLSKLTALGISDARIIRN